MLDDTELLAMYDAGITISGIATELGMSTQTVRRVLQEHGKDTSRKVKTIDEEDVITMYKQGEPIPNILNEHGISYNAMYTILAKHDVTIRKVAGKEVNEARIAKAVEMYQAGAPLWSIKQETGVPQPTLHAVLHQQGIPLRRPRML
jgi:predicted transcriptional regulator